MMLIEIKVPDIGADEVEITEMMVKVGDYVKVDQALMTVEGNKASMEVPSPKSGIIKEIKVKVGDKAKTNTLIMIFESEHAVLETEIPALSGTKKEKTVISPYFLKKVKVPDIGDVEVEVTSVMVNVGDEVDALQSLITVNSDKLSLEVPALFAGIVKEIYIKPGDKVKTSSIIMGFFLKDAHPVTTDSVVLESQYDAVKKEKKYYTASSDIDNEISVQEQDDFVHATPTVRCLAREFGINLAKVKGSGRKGRILREDIQDYVKDIIHRLDATSGLILQGISRWPRVEFSKFGDIEESQIGRIQKVSSANLSRNWVMIPHVTHFEKSDITDLEEFRKKQNNDALRREIDIKFTPVVFIMKAVAIALKKMPRFNSALSEGNQRLILKKYINIGIAMDTENGLVVPVFKDVNKKGITELAYELMTISKQARHGKLTIREMQGGCFTISSLGGIGTTHFTPIVNAPEVAILGVSKSTIEPRWNGKEFIPRLMMPLSLSFDHRVIDGADGARFIKFISDILSDIRHLVM